MLARALSVLLLLLALSSTARAGDTSVALVALGGEVGGGAAGFLVGGAAGLAACRLNPDWECFVPFFTAPAGALLGFVPGATLAGGLRAQRLGLDDRRVRWWTAGVGLSGVALSLGGYRLINRPMVYGGFIVAGLGMPVAAGLAAGDVGVSLAPTWSSEGVGLRVSGTF